MYTVMIVDDFEGFRQDLRLMPVWGENSGFVVSCEASNGLEAVQKLQKNPVDLLLTDIRMPMVDGLELIKMATEESLCECIIIMSQFSDFEYARKGLSSGALDYLLKPVNQDDLAKVLERAESCISQRHQERSRIAYLEKVVTKNTESFFPEKELENLINFICEGNRHALTAASYLADEAFSELESVSIRTAQVLNKTLKKLIESVQTEFPWIEKFINLKDLKLIDYARNADFDLIKESFIAKIDILISTIRKYELDIDNDGMVRMACKTILENIDTDITISELANKLFITRTYLSQIFKDKTGITLVKYLTDVKIDRAKFLISSGSKHYEIAEKLGYKDDEYFKKLFKKSTGMTINEYKNTLSE